MCKKVSRVIVSFMMIATLTLANLNVVLASSSEDLTNEQFIAEADLNSSEELPAANETQDILSDSSATTSPTEPANSADSSDSSEPTRAESTTPESTTDDQNATSSETVSGGNLPDQDHEPDSESESDSTSDPDSDSQDDVSQGSEEESASDDESKSENASSDDDAAQSEDESSGNEDTKVDSEQTDQPESSDQLTWTDQPAPIDQSDLVDSQLPQEDSVTEDPNLLTVDTSDSDVSLLMASDTIAAYSATYVDPSTLFGNVDPPTSYQEVYDRMIALKSAYPEGLYWDNFIPFGNNGPLGVSYVWKGGPVYNANSGSGCMGYAFLLSDAAFGSLPARTIARGGFTFDDIRVGDILRVDYGGHAVIVLQKSAGGIIVAEANFNKSVHWGRAMSVSEVMDSTTFIVTRYPIDFVSSDSEGADDVIENGTLGGLEWSLTRVGTLTITGAGSIPDFSPENAAPWSAFKDTIKTVIVEDGVTYIGNYAFNESATLNAYIADSVESIGVGAFRKSSLLSVTVPGSVRDIGNDAFYMCPNLTSVTVAEGATTIGDQAFRGCTALTHIDFPSTITSVGAGAFMSCEQMTRVRFVPGTSKVTLGDNLFSQCWHLNSVTLPQTADRITAGMFESCSSLPELYIPASVTEIGENPFVSCRFLGVIRFGGSQSDWDRMASPYLKASLQSMGTQVVYDVDFDDPFAKDPNDPGDFFPTDPDPDNPDQPPVDPNPSEHQHDWAEDWSYDSAYHWHECLGDGCSVSDNHLKDGYGEHNFAEWIVDTPATNTDAGSQHRTCETCARVETAIIPTLGDSGDQQPETPEDSDNTDPKDPENPDDSSDPGDQKPDDSSHPGTIDPDRPAQPETPTTKPETPSQPSDRPNTPGGSVSGNGTKPNPPSTDRPSNTDNSDRGSSSSHGKSHRSDDPIQNLRPAAINPSVVTADSGFTSRTTTVTPQGTRSNATSQPDTQPAEASSDALESQTEVADVSTDEDGYINDISPAQSTEEEIAADVPAPDSSSAWPRTLAVAGVSTAGIALALTAAYCKRSVLTKFITFLINKITK